MAEEKHLHLFHHNKKDQDDKPLDSGFYSEGSAYADTTTTYSVGAYGGGAYSSEENIDYHNKKEEISYKKEEKHHKHLEHLRELGTASAGTYALKHKTEKDLEHAHKHKIEEEIAAAVAVGSGVFAFHEHHEKKEVEEEDKEAHGKKHHHLSSN